MQYEHLLNYWGFDFGKYSLADKQLGPSFLERRLIGHGFTQVSQLSGVAGVMTGSADV